MMTWLKKRPNEEMARKQIDMIINESIGEYRRRKFLRFFEKQMNILESCNCPLGIIKNFRKERGELLTKVISMNIPKEHIPFIPVIPNSYLNIYELVSMLQHCGKLGFINLNLSKITNRIKIPKNPYFMLNVEDGESVLGKSPRDARKIIQKRNYSFLTIEEGIALVLYTDVLSDHFIDCSNSQYVNVNQMPHVSLENGNVKLYWGGIDSSDKKWGSASCYSRIVC